MSEIVKINGYDIKDLKSIRVYDTVALMKADSTLRVGQHIKTRGYYTVADGGEAEYIIKSSSIKYYETLNNNLVAELIYKNIYNVKQFGIQSNTETSQNDKLDSIISIMNNGDTLYFPSGKYYFTRQIVLLNRINLIGDELSTGEKDTTFNGTRLDFHLTETPSSLYYLIDCQNNNKTLIKNIYVIGNSYTLTCDRTLQSTTSTPVDCFTATTIKENVCGIRLYNYGSTLQNVIIRGCSGRGVNVGFYNLVDNVRVYESNIAFYLMNDNTLNNCNCFTCNIGISIGGAINLINNFRADEIKTVGIWCYSNSNNINNFTIDYAQYNAIQIEGGKNNHISGNIGRVGTYYAERGTETPGKSCYAYLIGAENNRLDLNISQRDTQDGSAIINSPCYSIVTKNTCSNNRYTLTGTPKGNIESITDKLTPTQLKNLLWIESGTSSDIIEYEGHTYQLVATNNTYPQNTIYSSRIYKYSDGVIVDKSLSTGNETSVSFDMNDANNHTFLIMITKNGTSDRGLYLVGYSVATATLKVDTIVELPGVTITKSSNTITIGGLVSWSSVQIISNTNFITQ